MVKVFDETVKTDVIKALEKSEFDVGCTMEGKDIKVKLGTTKKEFIDAALKKIKILHESFKRDIKEVKTEMMTKIKKLEKILPQEEIKILEKDYNKHVQEIEEEVKKLIQNKEKEIKG